VLFFAKYDYIPMKIKISNLDDGTHEFVFEDEIEAVEIEEPYFGRFKTKVVLTKFRDQMILESSTDISANFICDRCAEPFSRNVNSTYKIVYLTEQREGETELIDVTYIKPDSDTINIVQDVRDFAMLAIPMKRLCSESCKGLCFRCGKNFNEGECNCVKEEINETWKPLIELKKKLN
jgi:uncharacterized protein